MNKMIFAGVALLMSTTALAAECNNADTQAEMNACAASQYKAADTKLNDAYNNALKQASPDKKTLLESAQQKWIALRDADCTLISSGTEGGSIQTMIHHQCLTDKTVERTAWLESLHNCEEGDLSCPLRSSH